MSNREYASKQLNKIQKRIHNAATAAGRPQASIQLIGASKQQPWETIQDFHASGLKNIGENYLQEALEKQKKLGKLEIEWHFIGAIQSNKTTEIANNFDWVHSVDRLKIAKRLSDTRRQNNLKPINILLQLNVDEEKSKSGVPISQASSLCAQLSELDYINLRGFMLIPKSRHTAEHQRQPFASAHTTLETINQRYGLQLDTLSMGMSNDLEAAVAEGSTMVRIGTDLFGKRDIY